MSSVSRTARQSTPERWLAAAQRAIEEGVEVRQLNDSGVWIATSASDPVLCYLLQIRQGIVTGCSCPAGAHGDPCCKHAAKFYLNHGIIEFGPETGLRLLGGAWA